MSTTTALSVTKLRAKYSGEKQLVFNDLTLAIPQGQKLLLLGPSGCGKSTLLQIMSGIVPDAVQMPLHSEHITKPSNWGFVFQDPDTQFCMSYVDEELAFVLENLRIPREQMELLMNEVLDQLQLKLPALHTPIAELSQGMKQRLALAAVLLLKPDVVFLDEPSALLDPEGKLQIWQAIRRTLSNHTVIVVEHHINGILDWFDRVVVFNRQGDIIADDQPKVVFEQHKPFLMQEGIWYPNIWEEHFQALPNSAIAPLLDGVDHRPTLLELENFSIERGGFRLHVDYAAAKQSDWITIIGRNGAGKSTLLYALARLLNSNGSYRILGAEATDDIPDSISYVFQNPELQFIADRIIDEVTHSLQVKHASIEGEATTDQAPESRANHWLHRLLKPKRKNKTAPKEQLIAEASQALEQLHLNVPYERHPYELSIGQKRRLSVLTALVEKRSIILLDEPTFGQDARSTFVMLEWLARLQAAGITIIMVTHDEQIVKRFSTQVWEIDQQMLTVTSRKR